MRSPLAPSVAVFEDNPVGGLSSGELLLAAIVVGAVGLGVYYATRPKTIVAAAPTVTGVVRPNVIGNSFNSSSVAPIAIPAGPQIPVVNGQQLPGFVVTPGQCVTLMLPSGATWIEVKIGNSSSGSNTDVSLGSDLTSPVSIPAAVLLAANANTIAAVWKVGLAGSQQVAFYGVIVL